MTDTFRPWMGLSSYFWEAAISMGTIPSVELFDRSEDAWCDTLPGLSVLYEVSPDEDVFPDLLEREYICIKIAARTNEYNYKNLTQQWWLDFFRSFFSRRAGKVATYAGHLRGYNQDPDSSECSDSIPKAS
jgi:hypothetical protein